MAQLDALNRDGCADNMLDIILVIVGLILIAVGIVSIFVHKTSSGRFSTPIFTVTGNVGTIVIGIGVACLASGVYLNTRTVHIQLNTKAPNALPQATPLENASSSPVGAVAAQSPSPASSPSASPPLSVSSQPSATPQEGADSGYSRYTNARFDFTMLWPTSLNEETPQPDGAGQTWTSVDGRVILHAYGRNNVFGYSPHQDEIADTQGCRVIYSKIIGNVVTVSGYIDNGRTIVYQRDVVGSAAIDTLYWRYPASENTLWDAAVTLSVRNFQAGNVATGH